MIVELREWSAASVDAAALVAAARLDVSELGARLGTFVSVDAQLDGSARIVANRKVGEVQIGELLVRVEPHIEIASMLALLGWLARARVHLRPEPLGSGGEQRFTLRQALAAGLIFSAGELLQSDLHRAYERREARLNTPRGRPQFARFGRAPLATGVPCQYLELTRDTLPNRALLAGVNEAVAVLSGTELEPRARRVEAALGALATRPARGRSDFIRAYDALGHRWQAYTEALDLARMLLFGGGPISVVGRGGMSGWWIDMPSLFERAVTRAVSAWAESIGLRARAQPRHRAAILDAHAQVYHEARPDIEILERGRVVAIVDAKYKEYLRAGARGAPARMIERGDLYQLAFYGQMFCEAKLIIVSPEEAGASIDARWRTLHLNEATLELVGVDLDGLPSTGALALW